MKDFDEAGRAGFDVKWAGDNARQWKPDGAPHSANASNTANPYEVVRMSEVDPISVDWLWEGYLALGKLTLLGGDPDLGKSQISIDMAARQSRGAHWPQGARAPIGNSLFICGQRISHVEP